MQLRNRIFAAILIPAAVLSIALPAVTLFTGDGFLAPYIRTPEAAKMLAEIAVLLLLSKNHGDPCPGAGKGYGRDHQMRKKFTNHSGNQ